MKTRLQVETCEPSPSWGIAAVEATSSAVEDVTFHTFEVVLPCQVGCKTRATSKHRTCVTARAITESYVGDETHKSKSCQVTLFQNSLKIEQYRCTRRGWKQ
jgi:hypothetical protein